MFKTIKIEGMICSHCEARIKKALETVNGVIEASVDLGTGIAKVVLEKQLSDVTLKETVESLGYVVVYVS